MVFLFFSVVLIANLKLAQDGCCFGGGGEGVNRIRRMSGAFV